MRIQELSQRTFKRRTWTDPDNWHTIYLERYCSLLIYSSRHVGAMDDSRWMWSGATSAASPRCMSATDSVDALHGTVKLTGFWFVG